FDTFNDAVRSTRPDLLVGDSNGKYISKAEGIPLVRVGLPIHDRVGAQRLLMVGYRGAMELLDRITNTILEAEEAEEPKMQTCSM
ncbi:MAG: nitrogenase associated protein N, partial [ANME-2 cluster archaeon]|nr:nitrogenase associated protein N [ANME-2 cluster archaeon]